MRIDVRTVSGETWSFKGEKAKKLEAQLVANWPKISLSVSMNNGGYVVLFTQHIESIYYHPASRDTDE